MVETAPSKFGKYLRRGLLALFRTFYIALFLFILVGFFAPRTGTLKSAQTASCMCTLNLLMTALKQYALDHDGHYPTGKSSTEVFQKLLDENYVSDPGLFLGGFPRPMKIRGKQLKLEPEDVGFDLTVPLDIHSPDDVPVIFLTGYRITYAPHADAIPVSPRVVDRTPNIAVAYQNQWGDNLPWVYVRRTRLFDYKRERDHEDQVLSDGTIIRFIPGTFAAKDHFYQQLTSFLRASV